MTFPEDALTFSGFEENIIGFWRQTGRISGIDFPVLIRGNRYKETNARV